MRLPQLVACNMKDAITTLCAREISAHKAAGDFAGSANMIARRLEDFPSSLMSPSDWELLMNWPAIFEREADHGANVLFMTEVMSSLERVCRNLRPDDARARVDSFLLGTQFRLSAHSDIDIKELMAIRARLFRGSSFVLADSDYSFSSRVASSQRPRVGVLFRHLHSDPETNSLLPFFSQAKESGIELILFVEDENPPDDFGQLIARSSDRIVRLPATLFEAVATLRAADLDILVYGNDITAKLSLRSCLSFHKVARRAICTVSTLVTTASPYVDQYFGCDYHSRRGAAGEFFERFVSLPSPGFSFSFSNDTTPRQVRINREELGLTEASVLFTSGANHTKLHGHLLDAWATILSRVSDSALFLYPFPPHFGPARDVVISRVRKHFDSRGVDPSRIIVLPQLTGRNMVRSLLQQMDIGLDSFPYPGVTTMVEAIEAHLPTVSRAGATLRSSQGAAVLASAGLTDLITSSLDEYINTAVSLASHRELREAIRLRIANRRPETLPFFDTSCFGTAAVDQYFRIHSELKQRG